MAEAYLGEIRMFGFNFAPQGWAFCNGQLLPISQNTALFSLLGTFYGGNGTTNFALPNLQSSVAIHQGQGPGLSPYEIGQIGGFEDVTLTQGQMPTHTHTVNANASPATASRPAGSALARTTDQIYATAPDGSTTMNAGTIANAGGSQPHSNIQPFLVISFCIALQGIYPSRN
jgi:microcystin-dependent protein